MAVGIIVIFVVAIVGLIVWRMQPKAAPVDEKGIPLTPVEARPGANALQNLLKTGVKPKPP